MSDWRAHLAAVGAMVLLLPTSAYAIGGICLGDFFCQNLTSCASTADCAVDELCVLDSCCGPGVCVGREYMCDLGQGGTGSDCSSPGVCGAFAEGCGASDPSCQVEFPETLCFTTDIVAGPAQALPSSSSLLLAALVGALAAVGARRIR